MASAHSMLTALRHPAWTTNPRRSVPEQRRLSGPGQPLTDSAFETVRSNVLSVSKKLTAAGRARIFTAAAHKPLRFSCAGTLREKRAIPCGILVCLSAAGEKSVRSHASGRNAQENRLKIGAAAFSARPGSGEWNGRRRVFGTPLASLGVENRVIRTQVLRMEMWPGAQRDHAVRSRPSPDALPSGVA
jgi:hypothetical protein